ncbi:MAG TPA: hypothetical protein VHD90_14595 [Phototrophicaceae bacterium]|nr:hypothetical protein [Phototrophicaceae bacterium]
MPFIGFILILMGLFAVGGTLFMVMREPQEHEEWYIPPAPAENKPEPSVVPPPTTSAVSTPVPTPPPADQPADKTE